MKPLYLLALLFLSCSEATNPKGEPWKPRQVWKRITARKEDHKRVRYEKPKNEFKTFK